MGKGFEFRIQAALRIFSALRWYALAAAMLVAAAYFLEPRLRAQAANWMSLIAMLLLAAPTIRLNEQGRGIGRVRSLIAQLEAQERQLAQLPADASETKDLARSIEQSRAFLQTAEKGLIDEKGGWSPLIQRVLYGGYALFFASALTRLL